MKSMYFFTALVVGLVTTSAFSQQLIYMNVNGVADRIVLTSAQFGESTPTTILTGGPTGKSVATPITITKAVDGTSSAKLTQNLVGNKLIPTIEIVLYNTTGQPLYKIELKEILIINHSISLVANCPNGCSNLAESFQLDYKSIRVTTYTLQSDGRLVTGGIYIYNRLTTLAAF